LVDDVGTRAISTTGQQMNRERTSSRPLLGRVAFKASSLALFNLLIDDKEELMRALTADAMTDAVYVMR